MYIVMEKQVDADSWLGNDFTLKSFDNYSDAISYIYHRFAMNGEELREVRLYELQIREIIDSTFFKRKVNRYED